MSHLEFEYEPLKAIAAIEFFALQGIPDLTKGKIAKLLFLADKLHLVRFGRTITGDRYAALPHGPIPSQTCNLLDSFEAGIEKSEWIQELASIAQLDRRFFYPYYVPVDSPRNLHEDELSQSDLKALTEVAEHYGKYSFSELRGLTHEMPAYEKAWERRKFNSAPMYLEEFFEQDEKALAGVLEEALENQLIREALAPKRSATVAG